jgi:hypothetical protein
MHEEDCQRHTPDTDENVMEQTAPQTIVEHLKIVRAMEPGCKLAI